jgi:hypothetical protein
VGGPPPSTLWVDAEDTQFCRRKKTAQFSRS